ncbi:MAG: DUF3060 domain-containing protein [Pseudomonadota bacterium]|nr:DUF3060 domain-containing protein [Pseudomonadota bacterium]
MRILTTALLLLFLGAAGCSEDDAFDNPLEDGLFGGNIFDMGLFGSGEIIDNSVTEVLIDASNTTQTVNRDDRFDLTVSGSENDITIDSNSDIRNMLVSGDRNSITFRGGSKVEDLDCSGNNNTIIVPEGLDIVIDNENCSDNSGAGSDNTLGPGAAVQ